MPYYSELGLSSPLSSAYSSFHLSGPYSNHSSIIASNYSPSYAKPVGRPFRGGYKPHLSTISELNSSLRGSPNLYYKSSPKVNLRPIKTINTADIDVSKNRLRKFEKYERPKTENVDNNFVEKRESPKRRDSPKNSVEEREAKPNTKIRRERPTVRIQTVHTDTLEKEIKSWRDNFEPDELVLDEKRIKKTPGEILKEKFLIRSRSKENLLNPDIFPKAKKSIKKSPSFHDICTAITSDNVEDELNPGQPVEIRRKQSRQLSTENLIREIRRKSTDLSEKDLQILDAIFSQQNEMQTEGKHQEENFQSRGSIRIKKLPTVQTEVPVINTQVTEKNEERKLKRRPVKKIIKNSPVLNSTQQCQEIQDLTTDVNKNIIRDISQVDVEQTKFKPKPIIKATVGKIEDSKPVLKAIVDEVEVEEVLKKPEKKFKFNIVVEVQDQKPINNIKSLEKISSCFGSKMKLDEKIFGKVQLPNKTDPIISNILPQNPIALKGKACEPMKKVMGLKMKIIEQQNSTPLPKPLRPIISNLIKQPKLKFTGNILEEKKPKQQVMKAVTEKVDDLVGNKERKTMIQNVKDFSVNEEIGIEKKDKNDNMYNSEDANMTSEQKKKIISKRSLVHKADKDDPDLQVFVPPEPEAQAQDSEENNKDTFVPLQSNRLTQFMHPWKKPEQFDVCPVELYARPKLIRGRHYPRPRGHPAPPPPGEESGSEEEADDEIESNSSEEGRSSEEEECGVNIHKKCEKLSANLCGVNQKLVVEAIENVRKDSLESRDSPTFNHASNPAFAPDSDDIPEEYSQSSTYRSFQTSGRITPPATTIPRFRKYCLDDFNFLKVLGKGSFGKVLLAELKGTEYYYAVKCLKKDVVLEDDDVECTLIERKVLALGTKHPYLCHLLCTFQTESHLFFVMEYLNGGDLMFHIQASGGFSEERARFYGAEIVSGLKFLHNKGIVYRDLKLDNVLLDFDGHVRIADFGMCKLQIFLDRMAETFCGTPDYMAPEIIKGQHYNQNVDWWSFGVLLYEMLLGQSPFSGCDEDELFWSICNEKPVLPRFLSAAATNILTLLLEKDASKRLGNRFCPHGDIQDHVFFKPIDWPALEARALEPPFKPNLKHPLDTQYFDKNFTTEKPKLTVTDQTILQSMDQTQFQGFSYTNPNATDK